MQIDIQSGHDFDNAHARAFLDEIAAFLSRRKNTIVPFETVRSRLNNPQEIYKGIMDVEVAA
ncbi:MAG: hypothetical protein WCR20_08700, partial [Verrucomicrobiota bacterium]